MSTCVYSSRAQTVQSDRYRGTGFTCVFDSTGNCLNPLFFLKKRKEKKRKGNKRTAGRNMPWDSQAVGNGNRRVNTKKGFRCHRVASITNLAPRNPWGKPNQSSSTSSPIRPRKREWCAPTLPQLDLPKHQEENAKLKTYRWWCLTGCLLRNLSMAIGL